MTEKIKTLLGKDILSPEEIHLQAENLKQNSSITLGYLPQVTEFLKLEDTKDMKYQLKLMHIKGCFGYLVYMIKDNIKNGRRLEALKVAPILLACYYHKPFMLPSYVDIEELISLCL